MTSNKQDPKKVVLYYNESSKLVAVDNTAGITLQNKRLEETIYKKEELEAIPNVEIEIVRLSPIDE